MQHMRFHLPFFKKLSSASWRTHPLFRFCRGDSRIARVFGRIVIRPYRRNYKRWAILFPLLILALLGGYRLYQNTHPALAAWMSDAWLYRKAIAVTNPSGGTLTNYQVSFNLNTSPTSPTSLTYLRKMNADCSDIRVADSAGTLLSYWVEESGAFGCGTTTTRVWTKIASLTTSGTTLYVYYGNKTAATLASGLDTFDFFDTFSGASVDASKWSTGGSPTVSGGALSLSSSSTLSSLSTVTDSGGVGKLIFRAKQAVTSLTGGKIGFSNTAAVATHFNTDQAAMLNLGSTEEMVSSLASTNLVSHHQLEETTTTDANQFKASGYLDTGKLSQAVSIYGPSTGSGSGTTLTFNRGAQISGNNYEHINTNQGSISFWVSPKWAGNDAKTHYFFSGNTSYTYIKKYDSSGTGYLDVRLDNNLNAIVNINSWTANSWHHVVAVWDLDNDVSGTDHVMIYVDSSTTGVSHDTDTGPAYAPNTNLFIGSDSNGQYNADSFIDDFAIYDRVLTTTEITALYNSGTGVEAGSVADPSLKFYAKMDGTGTLSPVTYNLAANSDQKAYNASTNTNGNMVTDGDMETAGIANWTNIYPDYTEVSKVSTGVFADTQALKVGYLADYPSANFIARQIVTVSANTNYYFSVWYNGANNANGARIRLIDGASTVYCGNSASYYTDVSATAWKNFECSFKTGANTSLEIDLWKQANTAGYVLFDNLTLTPSLVDNGGMEGTYVGGVAPGWLYYRGTASQYSASPHSGSYAQQLNNPAGNSGYISASNFSLTGGASYLVSMWVKALAGTGQIKVELAVGGGDLFNTTFTNSGWTRYSAVVKPASTANYTVDFFANTNASADVNSIVFDDVSIIPLDNVSGSLKAWTPVMDSPGANSTELVTNGTMEADANWVNYNLPGLSMTNERSSTLVHNGSYSRHIVATNGNYQGIYQQNASTLVIGDTYRYSAWVYLVSGSLQFKDNSNSSGLGNAYINTSTTGSWVNLVFYIVATSTTSAPTLSIYSSSGEFYADDVSVKLVPNPLSVQGDSDGVASTTSGARGNGYTFDGSTGYLRQKSYLSNIGTLSYLGNDTTTAEFSDDGQTFTSYATGSGTAYAYMIVVTNSDNTTSWGYIGASDTANHANIHTAKGSATRGWNGTAPVAGTKTPVGYEIRKTDYQITGAVTVGAWAKQSNWGVNKWIVGKGTNTDSASSMFSLRTSGANVTAKRPTFRIGGGGTFKDAEASSDVLTDNQWAYLVGVYVPSTSVTLYINGIQVAQNTTSIPASLTDSRYLLEIGNDDPNNNVYFSGSIDSPFVTASALTADQIKDIYNSTASHYGLTTNLAGVNTQPANSSSPTVDAATYHTYQVTSLTASTSLIQDATTIATSSTTLPTGAEYLRAQNTDTTNALTVDWVAVAKNATTPPVPTVATSEERGGGPVGYWKLDEGQGNTANDATGFANTGTITTATWQTEDMCVSGKCLKFNGTSDLVTVAATVNDVQTVEFWVRPTTNTASMLQLSTTATVTASSGVISAGAGFTSPVIYVNGRVSSTLTANAWNHVVVTSTAGMTADAIKIGKSGDAYTAGFIDDVKIYSYARSAAQIKTDYNSGNTPKGANVSVGAIHESPVQGSLSSGLVGYWKMDDVNDSSGNAVNLTNNATVTFITGKFNNGSNFVSASSQYLSTTTAVTGVKSVAFWVKPTSTTTSIVDFNGTQTINATGNLAANNFTAPVTYYVNGAVTAALTANVWNHVVITTNTGFNTSTMTWGKIAAAYFNGMLDEVRLYNRALTSAEVTALYNWGAPPSAYWNLDEKTGLTANDTSTNANTGTLNSTANAPISALSPTWIPARFGSGVKFNGLDQYISAADSATLDQTGSFSLAANVLPYTVGGNVVGGTVASKGKNYQLGLNNIPYAPNSPNRSFFTTSSITTQLSGTSITDVFFYDTTTDTNYGDGTAADPLVWRFDSTKSWYTETIDHPARTCVIASDDRCGSKEFPEKAYIVATATNVYIFDATENAMWMKFVGGLNAYINSQSRVASSVFSLNGALYFGVNNGATSDGSYLAKINYVSDAIYRYMGPIGSNQIFSGNISTRNSGSWNSSDAAWNKLVQDDVNDVAASVISGSTYVAVATDGGVSVINETAGTAVNGAQTYAQIKVFIANRLYIADGNSSCLRYTTSNVNLLGSGFATSFYCGGTTIPSTSTNNAIKDLYVTTGTSTIDGTSNTIYLGMNTNGVSVLQEKQGDETKGSVKFYTKDYISEEMVGDIRGAYSFNGTLSSSIANAAAVTDKSVKATDLTASNANGTGMAYAAGVRGTGITFDGTDDYLKQKVYYDQTGATFGPTVHGLNLAATAAFYRAQGRDFTSYVGVESSSTPYMLVLKDSANKTAWGYIGSTDAAEALSADKFDAGAGVFTSGTYNWVAYGSNTVENDSNTLKVTYVNNASGAYDYFSAASDLNADLTPGKLYKVTFDAKVSAGNSVDVRIVDGTAGHVLVSTITETTFTTKTMYFTADAGGIPYISFQNMGAGEIIWLDNITLKEVTDVGTDGVHIVSTRNGGTRTWTGIESGFNYNDTAYTFEVRKTDFQVTGNLTVGAWVKKSGNGAIVYKSDPTLDPTGFRLDNLGTNGVPRFSTDGFTLTGTTSISSNSWHFVVGVFDASTSQRKIYVDGSLDVSGTGTYSSPGYSPLLIGARTDNGVYQSSAGTIDEPFVTASALTADEIKRMYEVGKRALTAQGTNALNGSSNQVNAVVATGLSKVIPSTGEGSSRVAAQKLYAGTEGGGVSEIDLNSDTLVNYYTAATTPAINHANINALTVSPGGSFLAALDSGASRLDDVTGRSAPSASSWSHLSGLFDKDTGYYKLYENGILVGQTYVGTTYSPVANTNPVILSSSEGPSGALHHYNNFYGIIDDLILYPYARTAAQVVSDMNGFHSIVILSPREGSRLGSALAYYKFDEGQGTVANNSGSGGSTLNGTLTSMSSPATATSGWTNSGKFGKGLVFDGSDDYVDVTNNQLLNPTTTITISAWVNSSSSGANYDAVVDRTYYNGSSFSNSAYELTISKSNNSVAFLLFENGTTTRGGYSAANVIVNDTWQHVAATYDGSNINVYVSGKLVKQTAYTGTIFQSSVKTTIGTSNISGTGQDKFLGFIDEVKIYPFALTADEVKIDYNKGVAMSLSSVSTLPTSPLSPSSSAASAYCVPGSADTCTPPVAQWNLDEKTGQYAYDNSGNANTGTLGSAVGVDTNDPTWSQGKFGEALKFDGVNDYVNTTDIDQSGSFTIESWVYPADITTAKTIISKGTGTTSNYVLDLRNSDNSIGFLVYDNVGGAHGLVNATTQKVGINQWSQVVGVYDTVNTPNFRIYLNGKQITETANWTGTLASTNDVTVVGARGTSVRFTGSIDQSRIYNYARTPAQIAWDYNQGDPVAHYKMNECTGTVINDASGQGNTGTLTGGTPGTCTDGTGTTLWNLGASGKYNASLKFDGTNYVTMPTIIKNVGTVSMWVKPTSVAVTNSLISLTSPISLTINNTTVTAGGWSNTTIYVDGKATTTFPDTNWHLVTVTTTTAFDTTNPMTIGKVGAAYYTGQLDDVRIYNYALNATQIKTLYNQNSAVKF